MKRGAVTAKQSELVALWIPLTMLNALDLGVIKTDSDRSKFIRIALRDRLMREGIVASPTQPTPKAA